MDHTNVFRTYDVTPALSATTTLDRVASALHYGGDHWVPALINCEDEVYIAATLGCTMGIMRHPLIGLRPNGDPDTGFNGPHTAKRRMDEVVRAIHWQRLAAPFATFKPKPADPERQQAGTNDASVDSAVLVDSWTFHPGETWDAGLIGKTVRQGAPARLSRGLPLPTVKGEGEKPFVIAGRFPNGATAVAALGRTTPEGWSTPLADVVLDIGPVHGPIGIFGHYHTLTLRFAAPLGAAHVLAQDLAGHQAYDITNGVRISGPDLALTGALIDRIGLLAATPADLSDPGLVLVIR